MTALKKGTKLTDNPKDYMLRVRLDEKTLEKLNCIADNFNVSRSEIVRKGIELQYKDLKK